MQGLQRGDCTEINELSLQYTPPRPKDDFRQPACKYGWNLEEGDFEDGSEPLVPGATVRRCKFGFCAPGFANLLGFCVPFE